MVYSRVSWCMAIGLLSSVAGCAQSAKTTGAQGVEIRSIHNEQPAGKTAQQLQSQLMAFADLYTARVVQATDIMRERTDSLYVRARLHDAMLGRVSSAVDIAVGPNPAVGLLDMVVLVTLEREVLESIWIDELFPGHPEQAEELVIAMRELEAEIWEIASEVLTTQQRQELRAMITEWREQNPDMRYVWVVNFQEFAKERHASMLGEQKTGGLFAEVGKAVRTADEARLLAERAMYRAWRMPFLLKWEGESLLYDVLQIPEVQQGLAQSTTIVEAIERLPEQIAQERDTTIKQVAEAVATERQATLEQITQLIDNERAATIEEVAQAVADERAATIDHLMDRIAGEREAVLRDVESHGPEIRKLLVAATDLMESTNAAMGSATALAAQFETDTPASAGPSEPVDVQEYAEVVNQVALAAQEMTEFVDSIDQVLASPTLGQRLPAMVGDVREQSDQLLVHIFWLGVGLIAIFMGLAFMTRLTYQLVSRKLIGPTPASQR